MPPRAGLRWCSIQEGHVPQRPGLPFRVHKDPVPAVQDDRLVVGVPDAPPDVDPRIPTHDLPVPPPRLRVAGEDLLVLARGDAVRVPGADVERLAAGPVEALDPVRPGD